ncbi:hypothetical protein DFJ74DRAFT_316675 [Hyaloraphidium curvatum]|nr:hypothetical protein DFJ74DRAFT_316675 [Hyaloraphidium curvatum]
MAGSNEASGASRCSPIPFRQRSFQSREGTSPRCLPGVLRHLVAESRLVDVDTYFSDGTWKQWMAGALSLPFRVLRSLAPGSAGEGASDSDALPLGRYVAIDVAKDLAQSVTRARTSSSSNPTNAVVSLEEFRKLVEAGLPPGADGMSSVDLAVVLHTLIRMGAIAVDGLHIGPDGAWPVSETGLVKFLDSEGARGAPAAVSELDKDILRIRTTLSKLQDQLDLLQERVRSLETEAKERLRTKEKARAIASLKQKALVSTMLSKSLESQNLLLTVLHKIEMARQDAEMSGAIEAGSRGLRSLVGKERVEEAQRVMDEWEDVLADQEELNAVLEPANTNESMEDEELELELEKLAQQEAVPPLPTSPVRAAESTTEADLEAELSKLAIGESGTPGQKPTLADMPDVASLRDPLPSSNKVPATAEVSIGVT